MVRLVETQSTNGVDLLAHYRASGAPEVFAQIMRAYGGMVYSVCFKVTKDSADAEDASQATFLTLAVQCKTGAIIRYLGPWLKKVAKRTSLDLVRSRKRRTRRETVTAENRPEFDSANPGTPSENGEIHQIIRSELDQLPAKYRMPLVLHYFGGLNHDEISREMRCTTAALGVRLHRARKMLGKRLTARGISLEGAALGLAIAAAVRHVIDDHLVHATTHAMVSLTASQHPVLACANLPAGLGMVPQLVQQVAHSMARARMRLATVALGLSVTMLGGAAEAVRHLPDSIRPNLDFLSPTRALENLFKTSPPVPRLQNDGPTPLQIAEAPPPRESDEDSITPFYAAPPPVRLPGNEGSQRFYAFKVPFLPPVVSPPIETAKVPAAPKPTSDHVALPPRPTRVAGGSDTPRTPPQSAAPRIASSSGSSDTPRNSGEVAAPKKPQQAAVGASPRGQSREHKLTQYIPPPSAFESVTQNVERIASLRRFGDPLAGGGDIPNGSQPVYVRSSADGMQVVSGAVTSWQDANSYLPVRSNQLYVHSGSDRYRWSDPAKGIEIGGRNSIDFAVINADIDGLLTVRTVPLKSPFVPPRPEGHKFIGLWQVDSDFNYDQLIMTVNYDYQLADSMGLDESILKLWVYDTKWTRIQNSTFERDLESHALGGRWDYVKYIGVSAPEPAGVFAFVAMGGAALLRRRRKQV